MPPYGQLVVTRHIYHSGVTGGERELRVYNPPGYDRKKRRYPVLYLTGGSGDCDCQYPDRASQSPQAHRPARAHFAAGGEPVRREKGSQGHALSGLSMGGRHMQLVGFRRLDLFGSFGVLSAGEVDSEKSISGFLNDPAVNRKED